MHGRIEYWDAALPGFGLRVTEKGAKSWTVLYRLHGRLRRSTLGGYPALPLAEARDRARDVLREVDKGNDPAIAKAEERPRAPRICSRRSPPNSSNAMPDRITGPGSGRIST
jgi:hypothetical protein